MKPLDKIITYKDFEDYLRWKIHEDAIESGFTLHKDTFDSDFEDWLVNMDPQEWIDYADNYALQLKVF